jgi:hypothetical protein
MCSCWGDILTRCISLFSSAPAPGIKRLAWEGTATQRGTLQLGSEAWGEPWQAWSQDVFDTKQIFWKTPSYFRVCFLLWECLLIVHFEATCVIAPDSLCSTWWTLQSLLLNRLKNPDAICCHEFQIVQVTDPGGSAVRSTRSRCFVNDVATSLRVLRDLGALLVDGNNQQAALALRWHYVALMLMWHEYISTFLVYSALHSERWMNDPCSERFTFASQILKFELNIHHSCLWLLTA